MFIVRKIAISLKILYICVNLENKIMADTTLTAQNILDLPVQQQLPIIRNLLQKIKDNVFTQMENDKSNSIKLFYQILSLNNETNTLNLLVNNTVSTQSYNETENKKESIKNEPNEFQKFLLTAPTWSDEDYDNFIENRKYFNQWKIK